MIRKHLLILGLILIIVNVAFAQQNSNTAWGIKGGINLSGLQTDNILLVRNEAKMGWQAGVFSKSTTQGWGYLAELQLITLGSKQMVGDESQRNTIGYLSVPLAFQYRTEAFGFYLGGYAAFRLWAKRKSSKPRVPDIEANIKDNVAFMDYGVFAGINYTYQRFLFDIRYQQGIPNINTNPQINAKAYNASGQISVGYFLN